jgi:hypothetical protein
MNKNPRHGRGECEPQAAREAEGSRASRVRFRHSAPVLLRRRCKVHTSSQSISRHGNGIRVASRHRARTNSLRATGRLELISFLKYYSRLRLEVLLGRRATSRPLGIAYRWKVWNYVRHIERVRKREWLSE